MDGSTPREGQLAMSYRTSTAEYGRYTLVYDDYGVGDRVILYLHGLLLDSEMNRRLADALVARGHRVVLLDLLGHGRSDKPGHASVYRMDTFADQVVAVLDDLGASEAVLGGLSLGANVSLYTATRHPERVRALILEMPVLEWAVPFAGLVFAPMVLGVHYGRRIVEPLSALFRRIPPTPIPWVNSVIHALGLPPSSIAALLHGILVGPTGPTQEERAAIAAPTLICAHRHDLLHPYNDANSLAELLPNATLRPAASPIELRLKTNHFADLLGEFVDEVWPDTTTGPRRSRGALRSIREETGGM
jgi:pimeloyl-ACP methyl ester carboxylesterase